MNHKLRQPASAEEDEVIQNGCQMDLQRGQNTLSTQSRLVVRTDAFRLVAFEPKRVGANNEAALVFGPL
ncbi:hypothetical protein EYF80_053048 [Liparis tanakae]|uniref:Uncharacterized protein n=1 Tax=Liparis tanakae TaxID=230148 RepID=A0A4Z2F698_9TELE|nr:hypothetical protein EYF80_053048 [Liparis tanakae]